MDKEIACTLGSKHDLVISCRNNLLTCRNDLISHCNELLTCSNELLTQGHDFLSHGNNIKMPGKQFYVHSCTYIVFTHACRLFVTYRGRMFANTLHVQPLCHAVLMVINLSYLISDLQR